jgi:hypothetical protein
MLKNLKPEEQKEVQRAEKSGRMAILIWAERLSVSRGETASLRDAYKKLERDTNKKINLLERQKAKAETKANQNEMLAEMNRIAKEDEERNAHDESARPEGTEEEGSEVEVSGP